MGEAGPGLKSQSKNGTQPDGPVPAYLFTSGRRTGGKDARSGADDGVGPTTRCRAARPAARGHRDGPERGRVALPLHMFLSLTFAALGLLLLVLGRGHHAVPLFGTS